MPDKHYEQSLKHLEMNRNMNNQNVWPKMTRTLSGIKSEFLQNPFRQKAVKFLFNVELQ